VLNYHSAKHPLGEGAHNHTIYRLIITETPIVLSAYPVFFPSSISASIPDTSWYISDFGAHNNTAAAGISLGTTVPTYVPMLTSADHYISTIEQTSSGRGLQTSQPSFRSNMTERMSYFTTWADTYNIVKKYPEQVVYPNSIVGAVNFQANHTHSLQDVSLNNIYDHITYHSIPYSVTGSLTGYSGDGSGITIGLYNTNRKLLATGSTAAGGTYSMTWYDNTEPVWVEALDGANAGRSINQYAQ